MTAFINNLMQSWKLVEENETRKKKNYNIVACLAVKQWSKEKKLY